ncbi:hypothetical protein AT6N2_C0286 [Agrobacterium tumefaciens]|nr:hypothetical protein AT6N2_C0286 [Agrobacterium tumefaciens]
MSGIRCRVAFLDVNWIEQNGPCDFFRVALFVCLRAFTDRDGWTGPGTDDKSQ